MTTRKYPSYALMDLEKFVAEGHGNSVMVQEIAARKSGSSKVLVTPQLEGGLVVTPILIGRM